MSKESIGRDRWRQLGQTRYEGAWCPGCGLRAHVGGGEHPGDCTATYEPACPVCLYWPNVNGGGHRPDCTLTEPPKYRLPREIPA